MIIDFIKGNGGGGGSGYTLPTATSSRLGGVKIGSGIDVQNDGTISVSGGSADLSAYWTSAETKTYVDGEISGITPSDVALPVGYEAEDFTGDDGDHYGLAWIDGEREETAYVVGIDGNRVVCYVGDAGVSDEYEARLYYFDDGYSDRGFVMGAGYVFGYMDGDDEFHPIFLEPGTYALEYKNMTDPDDTFNGKVMNIRYGSGWGEDNLKTIAWKLEEYGTLYEKTPLFTITEKTCPVIDGYAELVLSYKENPSAPVPVGGYRIELSTTNPEDFTADDIDVLNDFFAAVSGDTSIAEGVYIVVEDRVYRLSNYAMSDGDGDFTFTYATNSYLEDVYIPFANGEYSEGSHYDNDLKQKEEVISRALNDLNDRKVNGDGITNIVSISQSDYDNLSEYDPSTLYIIVNN